jgi:hypothetical protein
MPAANSLVLPIDTSAWGLITASSAPEAVLDYDTKLPKTGADGSPLYSFQAVAYAERSAQLLNVKFPGTPPAGIASGVPVRLSGLVANVWERNGKSGVSFLAAKVEALNGHAPKGGGAA